jgi:lysophospholipase L1-like esterase
LVTQPVSTQPVDTASVPTTTVAPTMPAADPTASTTLPAAQPDATTTTTTAAPTTGGPLTPATSTSSGTGDNVLVVGDSVMVGATPALQQRLPAVDIDAEVGRQLRDAADILSGLNSEGRLRPVVVVHLGNNGSATPEQLDRLMAQLSGVQRVVLITANAPRPWRDAVNDRFSNLAADHPNITVLDWRAVVEHEDGLIGSDGVHLTPTGAQRLAELVSSAINGS